MAKVLRLILGDQLNQLHSWYREDTKDVVYVMMEIRQETDYVVHHIQKILAFFMSMRNFSEMLKGKGLEVEYLTLDHKENLHKLNENLLFLIEKYEVSKFEYQLPDEFRLDSELKAFCEKLEIDSKAFDTEHFLTSRGDLSRFFKGKKNYLMESFYRHMRKEYDILMDGDQPVSGRWNYDEQNRKKLKDTSLLKNLPEEGLDVSELISLLRKENVKTIGGLSDSSKLDWPCTRESALKWLDFFLEQLLPRFGDFQDAMHTASPYLFHSRLSFALNIKLIHPLEVIQAVEKRWKSDPDTYGISQVEGFIRQILGWREFMRGVYWAEMPGYAAKNFFGNKNPLPKFFWTGETQMNCLKHSIGQSLSHAYAHHIQRLMVTGNFALLAGIDPDEVDQWYLGIYIDAVEWVEITNTRGMSQFADGGIVGTKPYVSSANYIDKMSDYCSTCHYSKAKKYGENACPFNSLYWAFYERNKDKLEKNPRIGFVYRTLGRLKDKDKIMQQAHDYLKQLEEL
ncbi:cryptochrome/photolyase family protein [Pleomorphovibrio marinus]|uniref:cryptochrome/photolyase family protein n=1 Tax=Pleomorphovibrio marinus TaxID=2164132 RepID=UPI000E0BCA25|nr:cryptochrome/photolyase family protein [Pleomorphovibrio marinus]